MNYWLVKSEPSSYSWDDLLKEKRTVWSGVRNFTARLHLNSMTKGDLVFFYHSNEGKKIVGIAKVVKEAYPDPTSKEDKWVAVDIKPIKTLKKPVSLDEIKIEPRLNDMKLLKIGRLSVSPVTKDEFEAILKMSESEV